MCTTMAERRCAPGADPLVATVVRAVLLFEPLAKLIHQLVPAELLELRDLLWCECAFKHLLEPFVRNFLREVDRRVRALEILAKGAIKAVELCFVLYQRRARQVIE